MKFKLIQAHKKIESLGLIIQNFGNISCRINLNEYLIKPSGIESKNLNANNLVKINISNHQSLSKHKPSSDSKTHMILYKNFSKINAIVHTHSLFATAWAQSYKSIPCMGTTSADFWKGSIPLVRNLSKKKVENNYEENTGISIVEYFKRKKKNYLDFPGVIVAHHGPFVWGTNLVEAVKNAEALEFIAKLAFITHGLGQEKLIPKYLIEKHFNRKHGSKKYYGQ